MNVGTISPFARRQTPCPEAGQDWSERDNVGGPRDSENAGRPGPGERQARSGPLGGRDLGGE